jgi:hypothetical protein
VEQVEPESAVVGGGGLAWQEFAVHAKLYGKVVRIRSGAGCCRTVFSRALPQALPEASSGVSPSQRRGLKVAHLAKTYYAVRQAD